MRDWSTADWVDPAYQWKPLPVPAMPERLLIDFATRCNLRCAMCPVWGVEDDGEIEQVTGMKLADGTDRLMLHLGLKLARLSGQGQIHLAAPGASVASGQPPSAVHHQGMTGDVRGFPAGQVQERGRYVPGVADAANRGEFRLAGHGFGAERVHRIERLRGGDDAVKPVERGDLESDGRGGKDGFVHAEQQREFQIRVPCPVNRADQHFIQRGWNHADGQVRETGSQNRQPVA